MTKAADLANLIGNINAGGNGTHKNIIINGSMRVAQRGTSSASGGYYTVDRWTTAYSTSEFATTQSQETDVPSGQGLANSYKFVVTTPETSLTGTDYVSMAHFVEAKNLQHLSYGTSDAKPLSLNFWVKSSVTGTYAVSIFQNDASRNIVPTYTINSADTWENKTLRIPGDTSGQIDNNTGTGFSMYWLLGAGASYTAGSGNNSTWGAYSTGNFAKGHTTDWAENNGATFFLTGVQLEAGQNPTEFEHESFAETLTRCQRYYYRINPEAAYTRFGIGSNLSTTAAEVYNYLPVNMRSNPSVETTGTVSNYVLYDSDDTLTATSIAIEGGNNDGNQLVILDVGVSSGLTDGGSSQLMANNNSSVFLAFNSEIS